MHEQQLARYSRHINLEPIGLEGQQRLLDATALIVGMGGLGSPAALYLSAAGVGKIVLTDFDIVELSNLQRQIAHTTDRIGELKTHSGAAACRALNPDIVIETIDEVLDDERLNATVAASSIVLDCSDNFPTRFAINKACVQHSIPLVSGAAIRFDGQVSVFAGHDANYPCYRCLYSDSMEAAETCAETGVLSPIVGVIGTVQATEAIKVLAGFGKSLQGRLLLLDGLSMEWREIGLRKNPKCPVCAETTKI